MKFRHSLQSRIIFTFCLFGAVLGTVFATIVYISLDLIDDHLVNNRLREEVEYFSNHYKYHNLLPRPTSPFITAYTETASMPLYVLELVDGLGQGLHENYSGQDEYHIAVQKLPNQKENLYLLYEVSALEFTEKRKLDIGSVLFGGVILVIFLGWWIGRLTSRKVISPVVHLSEMVRKTDPDSLPTNFSGDYVDDEVGTLASALEQSMKRLESFVEREHQFTRDASHELRTPVTVIKGAVELLRNQLKSEDKYVMRPLERIQRQVTHMQHIIEALLWLSREKISPDSEQPFPVVPLAREIIAENRRQIADKTINLKLVAEADPVLCVPHTLFQIALTNLIQNAARYTANGDITIHVRDDRVLVLDTGRGIDGTDLGKIVQPNVRSADSNGFGLGLSIVDRLCHRLDWQLIIESEVNQGTTVQLIFH
ncbi:MAG: HAMP domain-containing sensor histidine kinase [Desulfobacteraceae bacterium]|jgi:signal transduction histidine kinase